VLCVAMARMSTADLHAEIAEARTQLAQRRERCSRAVQEQEEATERQRLRRVLDAVQDEIECVDDEISRLGDSTKAIDNDREGYLLGGFSTVDFPARPIAKEPATNPFIRSRSCCSDAVVAGELEWTIEGMSWLESSLKQWSGAGVAYSDLLKVGDSQFHLVYGPGHNTRHCRSGTNENERWKSSLAVRHLRSEPLTLRHSFFIKRNDGEFVQWGEMCEECYTQDCPNWHFGPDTVAADWGDSTPAAGIFGLSHEALLRSEWVKNDALTVKVELEVRLLQSINRVATTPLPAIEVPPPSLSADFLAQLESANESGDVTFFVDGERICAHTFVVCARSEVFSHMLRGPMREAASRDVTIEECDAVTFRALLRFLYTDDLQRMDEWIKEKAVETGVEAASARAAASDGVTNIVAVLQRVLACSNRYQVERLRLWSEKRLVELVSIDTVCCCLCQAHLYEAKRLEEACLDFISANHAKTSVTPEFGILCAEWPAVMLKISHKLAGVKAAEAVRAMEAATTQGTKRKRDEP